MNIDKSFRKFVVKKMVNNAKYNPRTHLFEVVQISLGRKELYDIEMEGKFYNYSMDLIEKLVEELLENGIDLQSKKEYAIEIDPLKLRKEQHLIIWHELNGIQNYDEFLKIGKYEFLLIDHDRGSLKPGLILKTVSSPWQSNAKIKFEFLGIDSLRKYYYTGKVTKFELVSVPPVFKILQSKEDDYRKTVFATYPEDENGFKATSFSLDATEKSYYCIQQNGGIADYSFIADSHYEMRLIVKDFDKIITPACEFKAKPTSSSTKVSTVQKGLLYYEEGYWKIKNKAKIEFE